MGSVVVVVLTTVVLVVELVVLVCAHDTPTGIPKSATVSRMASLRGIAAPPFTFTVSGRRRLPLRSAKLRPGSPAGHRVTKPR